MSWKGFIAFIRPRTVLLYTMLTSSAMGSLLMAYEGYSNKGYKHLQEGFKYVWTRHSAALYFASPSAYLLKFSQLLRIA
jgi:hypothetical protein